MCGFAGFIGSPDRGLLEQMGDAVKHRGPDQNGLFEVPECSLIHKRLSIIDLSDAGRQPLTTSDERYTVAYNGEIYNYRDLRRTYETEGWKFQTQTDTECLLASAALHGLRDLHTFHGIFAFAVWDAKEKMCYLARDRMGIKPLFFSEYGDRLAFASEIPALLHLKSAWQVDDMARGMYLTVGYIQEPRTIFRGIRHLEPGTLFSSTKDGLSAVQIFGKFSHTPFVGSKAEARDRLCTVVDAAVGRQLVSDRPVGIFLSGGLDSSVVLSSMRLHQPSGAIKTFTTRFRHNVKDPKFNIDADLARRTAKRYNCEHNEIEVGAEDVLIQAEAMARHLGQPHNNSAVIALDAAARLAAQQVPVVLSGDGGDELFGGYHRYQLLAATNFILQSPHMRRAVRFAANLHSRREAWSDLLTADNEAARILTFHALPLAVRRECFGITDDRTLLELWDAILREVSATDPVSRFMALDRSTWLRDDAFVRSDRLTMRHGVELRVPILDDEVVSFALGLPRNWLVTPFRSKILWRETFADRCLPEVANGAKRGWITPAAKWLRAGLTDWTRDLLEEAIRDHAWVNGPAIRRAFDDHLQSRRYGLYEIWTVLAYQLWWREYRVKLEGGR